MDDRKAKYFIEEYKALRAESMERFKMVYTIQRNSVLAAGAMIGFTYYKKLPDHLSLMLMLAASVVLLFAMYQSARMKKYGMYIGEYIKGLEKYMCNVEADEGEQLPLGWERFITAKRLEEKDGTTSNRSENRAFFSNTVIDSLKLFLAAVAIIIFAITRHFSYIKDLLGVA